MTEQAKRDYIDLVLHADTKTPTMKHVLLTIAAMANENGRCRPSIRRLEILTGLNRRTIIRKIKDLEIDGWLFVDRIGTLKRKETSFYELNPFKLQDDKVLLEGGGTQPLHEAQDPYSRGTVSPNTKHTPAPRPTAAPQAQAGGSGAGSKVKEEGDTNTDSLFLNDVCEETEPSEPLFDLTEPEEAPTASVAVNNPYKDREYITQAEWDEAYKLGISPFELPEVIDEPEEFNAESLFS